ncbi:hypothetical protein FOL47_001675 [Perkinsus chesapeaki]|uniref:EamA domain-containing protein n=1 Tax=Perkinsus chesapeaki TaxID=330153 RepID=A0A7J6KS30_PERCH|nr:hypothetical protein FOL47_001675 [Perkinsus chesapeaki]
MADFSRQSASPEPSEEVELTALQRRNVGSFEASPTSSVLRPSSLLGSGLCILSAFFFSLMQVCAHIASDTFSSSQLMLVRSMIQLAVCLMACLYGRVNPLGPPGLRSFCLLRGFLGAFANFLLYYAISAMPVADANAIFFTNPLFTMLYAICLLKEPSTKLEIFSLVIGFVGVIFVARPSFLFGISDVAEGAKDTAISAVFATLLGALVGGFVPIVVRYIGSAVHHYVLVFYWGITAFGMSLVIAMASSTSWFSLPPFTSEFSAYTLGIVAGIFGVTTQFLYNRAMQIEKPQTCSILRQLEVVFAFFWQHLATHSPVKALSVGGAILIVVSTLLLLLQKIMGWKRVSVENQVMMPTRPAISDNGVPPIILGKE